MLYFLLFSIFTFIAGILYCCIRCASEYDKEIEDMEQEEFLKNWK